MNKQEEIEKLKQTLMEKVKSENDSRYTNLSSDEIMETIINSSNKGKYILWVYREYLKGNIQKFEDIESRCKQALVLFKNNLSKFTEQQKQLNKMSFQELETLVSPYQEVLTQNEIKRMNKEKIWSEIDVIYEGPEGKIYIPKTKEASVFLGQGTRWCTASSSNNNYFSHYNKQGPLYILVTNDKDENGREIKYQFHFETNQFMNFQDIEIDIFNQNLISLVKKIPTTNIPLVSDFFLRKFMISDKPIFFIFFNFIKIFLPLLLCVTFSLFMLHDVMIQNYPGSFFYFCSFIFPFLICNEKNPCNSPLMLAIILMLHINIFLLISMVSKTMLVVLLSCLCFFFACHYAQRFLLKKMDKLLLKYVLS